MNTVLTGILIFTCDFLVLPMALFLLFFKKSINKKMKILLSIILLIAFSVKFLSVSLIVKNSLFLTTRPFDPFSIQNPKYQEIYDAFDRIKLWGKIIPNIFSWILVVVFLYIHLGNIKEKEAYRKTLNYFNSRLTIWFALYSAVVLIVFVFSFKISYFGTLLEFSPFFKNSISAFNISAIFYFHSQIFFNGVMTCLLISLLFQDTIKKLKKSD